MQDGRNSTRVLQLRAEILLSYEANGVSQNLYDKYTLYMYVQKYVDYHTDMWIFLKLLPQNWKHTIV